MLFDLRKLLFCILILNIFSNVLFGQIDQNKLPQISVDFARFKAPKNYCYLEIYFTFPRKIFEYKQEGNTYKAKYEVEVNISKYDSLIVKDSWHSMDVVDSLTNLIKSQGFIDIYSVFLQEGNYKLVTTLKDLSSGEVLKHESQIEISPFSETNLEISDIQLASQIVSDSTKGRFVKNGFLIFPNPSGIYSIEKSILYYYTEIYNLSPLYPQLDSTYTVQIFLKELNGKVVKEYPAISRYRKESSVVELGKINIPPLIPNVYRLHLEVVDGARADTTSKEKAFILFSHSYIAQSQYSGSGEGRELINEYYSLSEEELDEQFENISYIAIEDEIEMYEKMDLEGKKKFFVDFWKKRDSDPSTNLNEYKNEYLSRVAYANERYHSSFKKGWKTDRGRILILYGEPDQIENYPSSIDRRPYQIWYYYSVEGGIKFIFVDISGFGEMRLVHSTARNEIHNEAWQQRWLRQFR